MNTSTKRLADEQGDIDLGTVARRLWLRRWWMVAGAALFAVASGAAAFLMTPVYRATTVLVTARSDDNGMGSLSSLVGQLGGLASLAGISIGSGGSETEESLAVLRSREFTEKFIRELELMPDLFPEEWDPNTNQWRGGEERWPTFAQGYKYFDTRVRTISQDKRTGLITVGIEWTDRTKAALWANALIARLNAEMRAREIEKTNASVSYLEKERASTSVIETRQAIDRLMEAQINRRMLANVTQEYAFRVVDKAMPPDPEDVARPKKVILLALGPLTGLIFGAIAALLVPAWRAGSNTRG